MNGMQKKTIARLIRASMSKELQVGRGDTLTSATNFFEYLDSFRRDIEQMPQGGPVGLPDAPSRKAPYKPAAGGGIQMEQRLALHNKARCGASVCKETAHGSAVPPVGLEILPVSTHKANEPGMEDKTR